MIPIKTLQELADAVWVSGTKPKITYNSIPAPLKDALKTNGRTWAHAHRDATKEEENFGKICFSWRGLNRDHKKVIHTLAHELAHFRTGQSHGHWEFKLITRMIELDILRVIMQNRKRYLSK